MTPNVFSSLARYSGYAEENYLTETLVFVVKLLLEREPPLGLELTNLLACQDEPWFTSASSVQITTQVSTEAGTPDIELRQDGVLIYVEVKHDAPLGLDQLERYKQQLDASQIEKRDLVLLSRSRYSNPGTSLDHTAYRRLYWYKIHSWLLTADVCDEVDRYLCRSLVSFLEEQKMSVKQVDWQYMGGVPAMLDLTNMMETALAEAIPNTKLTHTAGWSWRGFYLPGDYWFGFRFDRPLLLVFEDNRGYTPVTYHRELDLQLARFFSLGAGEQLDCLVEFLVGATDGIAELDLKQIDISQ